MLDDSRFPSEDSVSRIVRTVSHHGLDDYNRYSSLMQIEKSPRIIPAKFGSPALRVVPASRNAVFVWRATWAKRWDLPRLAQADLAFRVKRENFMNPCRTKISGSSRIGVKDALLSFRGRRPRNLDSHGNSTTLSTFRPHPW
jgi:hypothetical protein